MKKVLFFDKLDYIALILAIILRPFFSQIVFRNANQLFQNIKLHRYLNIIGIKWISFRELNYKVYGESHRLRPILEKKYIKHQVSNNPYVKDFIDKFNLNSKQIEKLYLCFRQDFYLRRDSNGTTSSIILIKNFFPERDFRVYFLPYYHLSYLLLKELNEKNIKIIGFHAFINLIIGIPIQFFRFILIFFKSKIFYRKKNKNVNNFSNNKTYSSEIGFFPHQSLKYGTFFKKTYLYENDTKSPLFKEKVLTMFWEDTDYLSKRYFRRYNIPYLNVNNLVIKRYVIIETLKYIFGIISIKNLYIFKSLQSFFLFYTFLLFRYRFIRSLNILNQLRQLKVIYVHYDTLFPQFFLLACDTKGITTISSQERTLHYDYFSPLFYCKYLTAGQGFHDIIKQRGYLCEELINIGLPRSNLIKNSNNIVNKNCEKYIKIKKSKKLVLCFGLFSTDDFEAGIRGDSGTSIRSNVDFARSMLIMAKKFQNLYFVIRFKTTDTINSIPSKLLLEIKNKENIEINNNLKSLNSYELVSISDIVIGKYTSIVEETMSTGKKIIFYDNENYLSSFDFPLNKINVIERNIKGLENRINNIINGNYDPSNQIKNFVNKYFFNHPINSGFNLIKDTIKKSLIQ